MIKGKTIKNVFIFLFFLILSIKLFDLTLGYIKKPITDPFKENNRSLILKEYPPNLSRKFKPSDEYMKGTQNLVQKEVLIRTNNDGFIIGPNDAANSNEKIDIIFFGGSTTECFYLDEDKRFPYEVSQQLKVGVLNGGVSGNHSLHSILSLIGKGLPYKPKHIVLMHGINDLRTLSMTLSYWGEPSGRGIIQIEGSDGRSESYRTLRAFKNIFIPNLWHKIQHLFQGSSKSSDEWAGYRTKTHAYSEVEFVFTEQFTASLKSFVRIVRAWGIEPVLMTQFNRIHADDQFVRSIYESVPQPINFDNFVDLYQKANQITRRVAKEEGVYLIDLDKEIPSTSRYIYDAVHLTEDGSQLVAKKIIHHFKTKFANNYH